VNEDTAAPQLQPVTWTLSRVMLPFPSRPSDDTEPDEPLMRVGVQAVWEELVGGQVVMPSVEIEFAVPARREGTLLEIEYTAYAFARERLTAALAAMPRA
jgi:hypothetical protein